MKSKWSKWLYLLAPLLFLVSALFAVWMVKNSGVYPRGVDTLCHLYKGDVLYKSIKEGNWWPIYDPMWYNGVEMMRYWAPLPVYVLASCIALAGGNVMGGYLVYIGVLAFLCSMVWFYVGVKLKRPVMGLLIGLLWFYMPNNLVALCVEGNLPRTMCMVLLPLLLYQLYNYITTRDWKSLPKITVIFAFVSILHSGYAGMVLIGLILAGVIYMIFMKTWKPVLEAFLAIILGYLMIGIWLIPSLIGGITSTDSSEIMKGFFQPLYMTLNPLYRYQVGTQFFYFGLSAFLLCIFGIICAPRKAMSGFWSGLLIVLATSTTAYPIMSKLPGGQYLWMTRFISIALALVLFSLILWKKLKKKFLIPVMILLVLDMIPSQSLLYGERSGVTPEETMTEYSDWTLSKKAQEITRQRASLVDESILDAMSPYLLTGHGVPVAITQGAAWQSATTSTNFKQLDKALEDGCYLYVFDRSKELGNDTVIIRTSIIKDLDEHPIAKMDAEANAVGYNLVEENGLYRLYHLEAPKNWGTVSKYKAIGIGVGSDAVSRFYPNVEETVSTNLNDYSYEELSQYELIYLTGFTYNDKKSAEDLIEKLSENGVRVVITADGMPEDSITHERSFLGVSCNGITFANGYPEMATIEGNFNPSLFPEGYSNWRTVYLEGLTETWGHVRDNDIDLDFMGTGKNENLVYVGLNLTYYYSLTQDKNVGALLTHMMDLSPSSIPERRIVALEMEQSASEITIVSPEDNVNTALAYHDSFETDSEIYSRNHLTFVNEGETVIRLTYPHLGKGAVVTLLAIIGTVLYTLLRKRLSEKASKKNQEIAETESEIKDSEENETEIKDSEENETEIKDSEENETEIKDSEESINNN